MHTATKFPTPFLPAPRAMWSDVAESDWNDWRWHQKFRVRTLEQAEKLLQLSENERHGIIQADSLFHMAVTPYYAALMDPTDPHCPIRQQGIPTPAELHFAESDMDDPLGEERDMPVPGITHRYPDRVLFYTTHNCPVYCRHCTRKRKVSDPTSAASKDQIESGLDYIARHSEVRDVIISGGDPLSLSDDRLEYILSKLRAIPHVEILRLGTRNPVTLPQRITPELVAMIKKYHPIYVHTHFNHPKEQTAEAFRACTLLADAGCVLGNQMVLMKGINDDPAVVLELNQRLLRMRVRPYYIFMCDMSKGISHFRTPLSTGFKILQALHGHTSGMASPQLVIDAPGGGGKIRVAPNYIVEQTKTKMVLRNYEGKLFEYPTLDE